MENIIYLIPLFFLTALIYASVGFGGGSTYLALFVLFNLPYQSIPKMALICNLVVVSGGLYHYIRHRHLSFRKTFPFIVTSVPLAYLGGSLPVSKTVFLILLGISLAAAGVRLLFTNTLCNPVPENQNRLRLTLAVTLGGVLGFLSGLVGLGGGIFLAPLLYLFRWGNGRAIAATSCFFIFVNSLSGLFGQLSKGGVDFSPFSSGYFWGLVLAVFTGGQIGHRLSVGKLSLGTLQWTTAVLILFVAGRIFWGCYDQL